MSGGTIWRISLRLPDNATDAFEELLGRLAGAASSRAGAGDETWIVEGLSNTEPDRLSIETAIRGLAEACDLPPPFVRFDSEPVVDWLAQNLQAFPPVRWGRFWIAGTHVRQHGPPASLPLRIDASTAFGSGEHPTTGGCLTMIERLSRRRSDIHNVLDLGCGSGILAIAVARTWNASVTVADIDPESVRVARHHIALNGLSARIKACVADGYHRRSVRQAAPYDLVIANILARPLARLSRGLATSLAQGGLAIISGVLACDGHWMTVCHRYSRLRVVDRIEIDGWLTLLLARESRS